MVQATDGNLYGITREGGAGCQSALLPGCGTLFRITTAGKFTAIHTFCLQSGCPDGSYPTGLMQAADGVLYGTTEEGGANNDGVVFKITYSGVFTTLHSFDNTDGSDPNGVTQGSDGNFYGTTYSGSSGNCLSGCGTVFKMTPQGSLKTIYIFCTGDCSDGSNPAAGCNTTATTTAVARFSKLPQP